MKESLSRDQFRLYQLIWKRFTASRMSAAVYETTSVKIMAGGNEFTMTASRLKFDGFMSVYIEADEKEEKNQILSKLEKGEELELADLVNAQHFTQPPAHYTEASLVKAMESEAADKSIENNADYVLTFGEAIEMLRGKEVELEPAEETKQEGSVFGKRFGNGGGVTNAVIECFKEKGESADVKVARCSGAAEVKKALLLLKVGRLPEDFIEGMMCQGGCVGGPSNLKQEMAFKKDRDAVIAKADGRGVWENLKNYDMDSFSMHRSYEKPEA